MIEFTCPECASHSFILDDQKVYNCRGPDPILGQPDERDFNPCKFSIPQISYNLNLYFKEV